MMRNRSPSVLNSLSPLWRIQVWWRSEGTNDMSKRGQTNGDKYQHWRQRASSMIEGYSLGWNCVPLIWIASDAETYEVKIIMNINQGLLTVSSGDDEEELALWLRVVPWDGTVSLWWKSVPNPRPSRLLELYYLFNSSPLSVRFLQFVSPPKQQIY